MGYIAAIGSLVSTGAQLYGQSQQQKSAAAGAPDIPKALKQLRGLDLGEKPDAAMYQPIDFNQEQLNSIFGNLDVLPTIRQLVTRGNRLVSDDALNRANTLIPGYSGAMARLGTQANDLINARLPDDVIQSIASSRADSSSGVNVPGLAGPGTLKDLGLSSLDAINQGTGLLGKMVGMAESVSPRASYLSPQGFLQSPSERITGTMNQNALIQQSEQNANNLKASGNPNDLAAAQLITGGALLSPKGSTVTPNYGATVAQGLNNLTTAGTRAGWWGGGSGSDPVNDAGYYRNPNDLVKAYDTPGYRPVYGQNNQGSYFQYYEPIAA